MDLEADLELAQQILGQTAPVAKRWFRTGVRAMVKADGSPVTEADHAVERMVLSALSAARPHDAVLSEESGESGGHSARRWIIDPIDGTSSFAAGRPTWATLLALEEDGEVRLGVVDAPALGFRLWATSGGGAWRARVVGNELHDVTLLQLSTVTDLTLARVTANPAGVQRAGVVLETLRARCKWVDPPAAVLLGVLEGDCDILVADDYGDTWDHAPPVILVEEAGGGFFDFEGGRRLDTRHAVYTTAGVTSAARAALGLE